MLLFSLEAAESAAAASVRTYTHALERNSSGGRRKAYVRGSRGENNRVLEVPNFPCGECRKQQGGGTHALGETNKDNNIKLRRRRRRRIEEGR